ncbi:MAG TPA: hypothetical protein VJ891_10680 [Casimicrobiaceae bacterium]|nr:hypothetical protein [Casimicrobiaceae bacterium]
MRFTLSQLGLALAFATLSLGAMAQTTNTQPSTPPGAESSTATKPATGHAMRHHAPKHHAAKMRHERNMSMANENETGDSAYRAALRRCVTGPESQRDACLDQAISQYGHA